MIKIFTADQIRSADQYTIRHEPIASIDLMERASKAFVDQFNQLYPTIERIAIACGTGNNGGDGLAIARLLAIQGCKVHVAIIGNPEKGSEDFTINHKRLIDQGKVSIEFVTQEKDWENLPAADVWIDGIFGSGLSRPVEGIYGGFIDWINGLQVKRVAIDISSGLFANQPSKGSSIFMAHHTISFQFPKLAFLLPEHESYVGQWHVVDIGLHQDFIHMEKAPYLIWDSDDAKAVWKSRSRHAHKGSYGHVLLIAGSKGKVGAAILTARACLKSGVGLLTIYAPACAYNNLQTAVPEAMVITDSEEDYLKSAIDVSKYTTVAVGPGIGTHEATLSMLAALLNQTKNPMVIDADGINLLGLERDLLKHIPKDSILTPHPKEFGRISEPAVDSYERIEKMKEFSAAYKLNLLVKGGNSMMVTANGDFVFNINGNPGMATGGSGDVLTGVIAALVAQGYQPEIALQLGVFLHGKAGDLARDELGYEALTASDIINHLSGSFLSIYQD